MDLQENHRVKKGKDFWLQQKWFVLLYHPNLRKIINFNWNPKNMWLGFRKGRHITFLHCKGAEWQWCCHRWTWIVRGDQVKLWDLWKQGVTSYQSSIWIGGVLSKTVNSVKQVTLQCCYSSLWIGRGDQVKLWALWNKRITGFWTSIWRGLQVKLWEQWNQLL